MNWAASVGPPTLNLNKGVSTDRMAAFAAALRSIPGVESRLTGHEAAGYERPQCPPLGAVDLS
jgi:hypothetical protein